MICTGQIILKPPPVDKTPPRKKSWILENIKTPEKKFAREAREKFWAFFRLFFKAKWSKNGQAWKILKPRAEHFGKFGKY